MNEHVDGESLARINDFLLSKIKELERRQLMAPVMEQIHQQLDFMRTDLAPSIMVEPTIRFRRSVIEAEKAVPRNEVEAAHARATNDAALKSAQRRTRELEELLNSLS